MKIKIAPSILSADFGRLNEDIATVEPYVDLLHIDIMDGRFVPNITFGPVVVRRIKSDLMLDGHLMIENPELYVEEFAKAGCGRIVVHVEACGVGDLYRDGERPRIDVIQKEEDGLDRLRAVLTQIKDLGVECGISLRPRTLVESVVEVLPMCDEVLVMTVEPGFGGQKFMDDMVVKIGQLRDAGFEGDIAIDGGVNAETAVLCKEAGANLLVAGSYIFGADDRKAAVESLR